MRTSIISLALAATLSLTACEGGWKVNGVDTGVNSGNPVTYCQVNPAICIVAGAVVVGGVSYAVYEHNDDDYNPPPGPSDKRLKEDIRPVMKLENGIQLYAYHYKGDERMFVGVLAQDLLDMPQFAGAVSTGDDGYYRVDYSRLGLPVTNAAEMLAAGNRAAANL